MRKYKIKKANNELLSVAAILMCAKAAKVANAARIDQYNCIFAAGETLTQDFGDRPRGQGRE